MQREELNVRGMSCAGCEGRIQRAVEALDGVVACVVEYAASRARVSYDPDRVDRGKIVEAIRAAGYEVLDAAVLREAASPGARRTIGGFAPLQLAGIGVLLLGLLLGLRATGLFARIPEVTAGVGYGLLFVIGLFTSLHCVAMCGGINLSQSVAREGATASTTERMVPGLLYNAGRVVSYTAIGAVVGALGAVIGFSRVTQGAIVAVAGAFMVVMGVSMLDLFPGLRRFVPRMPRALRRLIGRAAGEGAPRRGGPFVVGLLNGLMPCGPLQSMQIYALGTGSAAAGALSMLLFSLGTVPLMLGFGAIATLLSRRLHAKVIGVSALLVAFLGVGMVARGMSLTGVAPAVAGLFRRDTETGRGVATIRDGIQYVETTLRSSSYEPIIVQAGLPLKWTVKAAASSINGCNGTMIVPTLGIQKRLVPGDNLIELTPQKAGDIAYMCWMGMIRSVIRVVPSLDAVSPAELARVAEPAASPGSGAGAGTPFGGGLVAEVPVEIPAERMAIASVEDGVQRIAMESSPSGFSPAVLVMQRGVPAVWELRTSGLVGETLLVDIPAYQARLELDAEGAAVRFTPQADFTLNTADKAHYAYVKVLDDLSAVDEAAIREEVRSLHARGAEGASGARSTAP